MLRHYEKDYSNYIKLGRINIFPRAPNPVRGRKAANQSEPKKTCSEYNVKAE